MLINILLNDFLVHNIVVRSVYEWERDGREGTNESIMKCKKKNSHLLNGYEIVFFSRLLH